VGAPGSLFVAELLIRLLRARQTCVAVGLQPLPRSGGATKTFRLKNVVDVFASVIRLFWQLRLRPAGARTHGPDVGVEDDRALHSRRSRSGAA
jgi:hypothetical protein